MLDRVAAGFYDELYWIEADGERAGDTTVPDFHDDM